MIRSLWNWGNPEISHEDVCVIFDVGNGSVGGSFVLFQKGKKPTIIYSVRYPIHIPERPTSGQLLRKMLGLLDDVSKDLTHRGVKHVDFVKLKGKDLKHVFCILSSPWYASKSKVYKIERKAEAPVTESFVKKFLEKEAPKIVESMGKAQADLQIIEQKVIRTKLNGYETHNPYAQVAREIELSVFTGMVPKVVLNGIHKTIAKHFSANHIAYHSFALMSFSTISDLFTSVPNYMFLDITSEVTEMTVVRAGLITDTLSLPAGKNTLLRKVAKRYKTSLDITDAYLKLYVAGAAEKKLKDAIDKASEDAAKEWLGYFNRALAELAKEHHISGKIFVTVDDDVAPIFLKYLDEARYAAHGKKEKFSVVALNKSVLSHFCTFGRGSQEDPFLAIESVYFNKIFHL